MINIGAVDTHIEPYTHTKEYSSEPQLPCAIPVASRYVTKPEVRFLHPRGSTTCPLCKLPRCRFRSLFSFLCFGIPVIKSHYVWPDDDGYRNTERAQEYLSIAGGANPNLELSTLLDILFHEPVSCRNCHPFTDDV
jgi:hypothetical protein